MKFKKTAALFSLFPMVAIFANDLDFDNNLSGWVIANKPNVTVEKGTETEGVSVRLKNNSNIRRTLKLEPNTKYRITFQIKGKNISSEPNQGAAILLNAGKKWERITSLFGNEPETGTFDWRKGEDIIDTANFTDSHVKVLLWLPGQGTVWFRKVKIEKITSDLQGRAPLSNALKFNRKLTGWKVPSAKTVAMDNQIKVGEMSVRLENGGRIWKTLQLEPKTQYEISFYIKGKGIQNGKNQGAAILLNAGKKWERITSLPGNQYETGTFDWKKGSGIIDTSHFPSTLIRVGLTLSGQGTVWFDEIVLSKKKSNAAVNQKKAVSFRRAYGDLVRSAAIVPQGIFGFFKPGEPIKLKLFIDGKAKIYEYTLRVQDESGTNVFSQEKTRLTDEITLPGQDCGYYSMESDIYADGKKTYSIQGGFAVAPPSPAKRDPFFRFGYGALPEMYDGLKRIGCGSILLKFKWRTWKNLDAKTNAENDLKDYKRFLGSDEFQLAGSASAGLDRRFMRSKEELAAGWPLLNDRWIKQYIEYLNIIVPKVKIVEWHYTSEVPSGASMKWKHEGTWSETMSNFVILSRIGSRQMKKINPEIKFIAGGNNVMERLLDIEPIHMGDLANDFDGYAIDAYTGNWDIGRGNPTIPEASLMKFYRLASELSQRLGKGKEIYNDEIGYSINYGAPFSEGDAVEMARLCARAIIISKAGPLHAMVLYLPVVGVTTATKDSDRHMAAVWKTIIVNDKVHRVPLPGGAMYATASSQLAFAKCTDEIIHENLYSYIFAKTDGTTLVTLWNIEKKQMFALELPTGSKVINMYGRDLTGQPLTVGPEPLYITIPRPAPEVSTIILKAMDDNSPEFACTSVSGSIFIRSFVKTTRNAEIRIPGKQNIPVKILPDRVNVFRLQAGPSAELISGSRKYPILQKKIPIHTLKRVSGLAELYQQNHGILRYPDHIRPIEAMQPERCYFKSDYNPNGHNVSAKYWTGYDDKNFYLAVEVDDPIHVQRHFQHELWRDDSLQFVLSPDDYASSDMCLKADEVKSSEYNFGLALTEKGVQLMKYLGKDAGLVKYPANVTRKNGITRYEVVIPWSAVGGKAKHFGFVVFDNNSKANKTAPYRLEFSPGVTGSKADSSKLKVLQYR